MSLWSAAVATLPTLAASHGALYIPMPRNAMDWTLPEFAGGKAPFEACTCNNGNGSPEGCDLGLRGPGDGQSCLWWSQGCSIGCEECATETYGHRPITGNPPHVDKAGFRKRYCNSTQEPTLPKYAWTLNLGATEGSEEDSYRYNPWRAPGHAPVVDACGQAGGEYAWQTMGGDSVFYNTSMAGKGMKGSKLPPTPMENRTRWKAGTWVEVGWGVRYNHGGGYQYRLCPASEPLTEECFQRHPLEFDRTRQVLKWNNGTLEYPMGSKAVFVDGHAVKPRGSTWARNPIPRIVDDTIGLHDPGSCPGPSTRAHPEPGCLTFPAPCPWDTYMETGLLPCTAPSSDADTDQESRRLHAHGDLSGDSGLGNFRCDGNGMGQCSSDWVVGIVSDHVWIPADLAAGEYVLGWRWDCEETAQIWSNCADVIITVGEAEYV